MPLKTKFSLFLLITLLLTLPFKNSSNTAFAQVTSGGYFIGDISMDEGGGKVKSGNITLKNTSIGQPFAGAYYVGGNLSVGSGHAYKLDPYPNITVVNLKITPDGSTNAIDPDAGSNVFNKVSGLRDSDGGQNYFNSLLVSPTISISTNNESQINLTGVAFTENVQNITSFEELTRSANASNGFLMLYANNNTSKSYYDANGALQTQNFSAKKYYIFFAGTWNGPYNDLNSFSNSKLNITPRKNATFSPIFSPQFSVQLSPTLGSYKWETYVFASSIVKDVISPKDPVKN